LSVTRNGTADNLCWDLHNVMPAVVGDATNEGVIVIGSQAALEFYADSLQSALKD
jgi:hypothetical protein